MPPGKDLKICSKRAQTMMEFMSLIGIIVVVLVAMSTWIQRGTQLMIKIVADQVGIQKQADQKRTDDGYLINQFVDSSIDRSQDSIELLGDFTYTYDDRVETTTQTYSNMGFTER